ncbi:glycerate kinase [Streptacidiphilus sp. P02-A3a]|uniref:glycerate kinase n=1 Tax=Streptacidiphilus sp. P02-A3a TaxID=2704468 RepID=UPI0015FBC8DD|nr:glycerate kinase [Streptacidiphilus sp. P02-A3a]QMU71360.1 glycerate kinase [Streptacidiphilus sp. P02-A3a]
MTDHQVLLAPDKFKGSLDAPGVADRLSAGLRRVLPGLRVSSLPVADGGEGTVDALVHCGFRRHTATATGPTGRPVRARYALRDGTAVVELAQASGLALLPPGVRAPLLASSRGTGELIRAALDAGARGIVLGLGGSACTDGGTGLLSALGARFSDAEGRPLPDGGGALGALAHADLTGLDPRLADTELVLATDVGSPLLGDDGAAALFGPQKGADPAEVAQLEAGLARLVRVLTRAGVPGAGAAASLPGAGAAGGAGYGALACLGARRRPGIDVVLDAAGIDDRLREATLVVTGEGSLDAQSLHGKAPVGVARRAGRHGVPVVAVCGRLELTPEQVAAAGFTACYPLSALEADPRRSIAEAATLLESLGRRIAERHLLPAGR